MPRTRTRGRGRKAGKSRRSTLRGRTKNRRGGGWGRYVPPATINGEPYAEWEARMWENARRAHEAKRARMSQEERDARDKDDQESLTKPVGCYYSGSKGPWDYVPDYRTKYFCNPGDSRYPSRGSMWDRR